MSTPHGNVPLFLLAECCGHPEPPELGSDWSGDDPGWRANDEWHADHQMSQSGERICILTADGSGCLACTEESDLPEGEFMECQLAAKEASQ